MALLDDRVGQEQSKDPSLTGLLGPVSASCLGYFQQLLNLATKIPEKQIAS